MPKITFEDEAAWDGYLFWQKNDRKTLKKVNDLIRDAARDPFGGIGKPEPLKADKSGMWSRRINDKDRLTYRVTDDGVVILSCMGHYDD